MADDSSTRTRPRGSLTREEIIKEALALLEQQGAGALSMRRLADRLGVAPNALYTPRPRQGRSDRRTHRPGLRRPYP